MVLVFFHFFLNFAATIFSVEPQKRYKFSYTVHVYLPQPRCMVRVGNMQAQRTVLVILGHLGKGTDSSIPHICLSLYQQNQRATSCRETTEPTQFHKDLLHKRKKLFGKCVQRGTSTAVYRKISRMEFLKPPFHHLLTAILCVPHQRNRDQGVCVFYSFFQIYYRLDPLLPLLNPLTTTFWFSYDDQ